MFKILGILFVSVFGTLLHFVYQWSGSNPVVALIAPVDESVFQHLKLLFTPFVLWAFIEAGRSGHLAKNFIPVKAYSVLAGMLVMVFVFYFYTFLAGRNFLWADISLFFLSVFTAFGVEKLLENQPWTGTLCSVVSGNLLMTVMAASMVFFTFWPPKLGLFVSP
ncbi:MAG: DUF6512 family protein [Emergencia sp.]|nr:DUF6512 family protein [Emergencia sp.]